MDRRAIFNKYLKHTSLQWFTQSLFFTFGALLIYAKTESILIVIIFALAGHFLSTIWKSLGVNLISKSLKHLGFTKFVSMSLILSAFPLLGIYLLSNTASYFTIFLITFSLMYSTGQSFYWVISNTVIFNTIGNLKNPGKLTSFVFISHLIASTIAAFLGILLNVNKYFLILLPIGGIILLASIIPLRGIKIKNKGYIKFLNCLKGISIEGFIANIAFMGQYRRTVLPLIIFLAFKSLSTSIWISGLTAIAAAFISYFTGSLKDKGNSLLPVISLPLLVLTWVFYGIVSLPICFVILGVSDSLLSGIISISKDANLSREVSNSKKPYETTVAIEFARSLGQFIILVFLLVVFLYTNTIPQKLLILGGLFVLPSAFYAIGKIRERRRALMNTMI